MSKPKLISGAAALLILAVASRLLLLQDVWVFWTWWLLAVVLGLIGMPMVGLLFSKFQDKGWVFSKALSIALVGYVEWYLVCAKAIPFTMATCIGVCAVFALGSLFLFLHQNRTGVECLPVGHWDLIIWEEVLFFGVFLIWTYFAGFNPAAYGTEKFMDYGFLVSMVRSDTLPARDIWYSQGVINYYYGGQYFAAFLTKLSGSRVELTYNLARTFIAAFAFTIPFALVRQMLLDQLEGKEKGKLVQVAPSLGGLTAGLAVVFCGNMHHMVYKAVPQLISWLKGEGEVYYWFPDATRYIGHNPDVPDKTIHEFPCYSFILGDLHAHVANILFVLVLVALLYAWLRTIDRERQWEVRKGFLPYLTKERLLRALFNPYLIISGFFLGLFKLNNYWDFVIYMVVVAGTGLFINLVELRGHGGEIVVTTLLQAMVLFFLSFLSVVPFEAFFERMVDGVALARYHSLFYQLLVLWGLPVVLGLFFLIYEVRKGWSKLSGEKKSLGRLMERMSDPVLFALLMFYCAFGLVLIPELVYVRDIYENGNARANTMFKLTYQAFMLFGMMMGFVIWHFLAGEKRKLTRTVGLLGLVGVLCTSAYFGNCVQGWYGGVKGPEERAGLDCTTFLAGEFIQDKGGIDYIKENVSGTPVVLEANGDSYTGYCRVSAMTGCPTVLGWFVHEWLWRSDPSDLNEKAADVESIYTSTDPVLVERLLRAYDVTYIFIGEKEEEKYEDRLTREVLDTLANVVYEDPSSGTAILKVYWKVEGE